MLQKSHGWRVVKLKSINSQLLVQLIVLHRPDSHKLYSDFFEWNIYYQQLIVYNY